MTGIIGSFSQGGDHADETTQRDPNEGWRRLHPLSPLLRGGLFMLVLLGIVLANLRDRIVALVLTDVPWAQERDGSSDVVDILLERNLVFVALGVVLLVTSIVVFFSWLGWRMHTFRVSGDAVEARSGVLNRQHRRAPLDRIQGVNLQRPLLARLLGLTMLEVNTAGMDGNVKLNYLSFREAKLVREQILARVTERRAHTPSAGQSQLPTAAPSVGLLPAPLGDPAITAFPRAVADRLTDFTDNDVDPATVSSMVTIPVGRLIGATLLSSETLTFTAAILVTIGFGVFGDPLALIALVPLAIAFGAMLIASFTRSMNFHLSLSDQGVRVSAGLISTITDTIPQRKIHAVSVRQPMGWRPFGWWQVRITTAGLSLSGNNAAKTVMSTMLPVGKIGEVLRVLDVLVAGHGMSSADVQEGLAGDGGDYVGSPKRAAWLLWWSRRRNGVRLSPIGEVTEPNLRLRRGWVTRLFVIVPITRMQSIQLSRGPLHRPFGLASLTAHTVLGPVPTRISGLDIEDARRMFDEISAAAIDAAKADIRGVQ